MKRIDLVNRLIQEGISEKTLVKFTDKQINSLAERILGEAVTSKVNNTVYSPSEVSAAKQKGQGFGVKDGTVTLNNDGGITVATKEGAQDVAEDLKGKQKKIDKNHNGVIDGQDFKILRGQKKKDTNEMLRFYDDDGNAIKDKKGKQSAVSTKDKDFEEKTKSKNIDAKDKKEVVKKSIKTCDDCGKPISKCSCDHSHLDENLKGNQKKIDANKNGKIDAQDFKILQGAKKDVKEGLFGGKHKKVDTIKHDGHEIDVYSKGNEKVYGHPRKEGLKDKNDSERLVYSDLESLKKSASLMNKGEKNVNFPKSKKITNPDYKSTLVDTNESKPSAGLSKEKKSAVVKKAKSGGDIGKKGKGFEKLADKAAKKYGSAEKGKKVAGAAMWKNIKRESVETKNWVKNLVENKYFHNFTSKNEIMELIKTKLNESETLTHEFGPKVKKGHNGIPEFMTYDAIVKSAEPATAPSKPKTSPGTKPGTKPGTNPKPKHPYSPDPGPNPAPKAHMGEEEETADFK